MREDHDCQIIYNTSVVVGSWSNFSVFVFIGSIKTRLNSYELELTQWTIRYNIALVILHTETLKAWQYLTLIVVKMLQSNALVMQVELRVILPSCCQHLGHGCTCLFKVMRDSLTGYCMFNQTYMYSVVCQEDGKTPISSFFISKSLTFLRHCRWCTYLIYSIHC